MRIRRSPRKAERVIRSTALPPSLMAKVARSHPELRARRSSPPSSAGSASG